MEKIRDRSKTGNKVILLSASFRSVHKIRLVFQGEKRREGKERGSRSIRDVVYDPRIPFSAFVQPRAQPVEIGKVDGMKERRAGGRCQKSSDSEGAKL
jgi:hypothetical protein